MANKTKTNIIADEELLNLMRIKAALKGITITQATEEAFAAYVADIRPHAEELRRRLQQKK